MPCSIVHNYMISVTLSHVDCYVYYIQMKEKSKINQSDREENCQIISEVSCVYLFHYLFVE